MLILFWVIVVLVGILCFQNTRYAIRQYLSNRRYLYFALYFGLLVTFTYNVLHLTHRVFDNVQTIHDLEALKQL